MSCYLVPTKQISVLSKWYITNTHASDRHCYNLSTDVRITPKTSEELAEVLAMANVSSINARYSKNDSARDAQYIKDCIKGAEIKVIHGGVIVWHDPDMEKIDVASIWNLCENLDYQSCEVEDWVKTDAFWLIRMIKDRATQIKMRTSEAKMRFGWEED